MISSDEAQKNMTVTVPSKYPVSQARLLTKEGIFSAGIVDVIFPEPLFKLTNRVRLRPGIELFEKAAGVANERGSFIEFDKHDATVAACDPLLKGANLFPLSTG